MLRQVLIFLFVASSSAAQNFNGFGGPDSLSGGTVIPVLPEVFGHPGVVVDPWVPPADNNPWLTNPGGGWITNPNPGGGWTINPNPGGGWTTTPNPNNGWITNPNPGSGWTVNPNFGNGYQLNNLPAEMLPRYTIHSATKLIGEKQPPLELIQHKDFYSNNIDPRVVKLIQALNGVSISEFCSSILRVTWGAAEQNCSPYASTSKYINIETKIFVETGKSNDLASQSMEFYAHVAGNSTALFKSSSGTSDYYNSARVHLVYLLDFYGRPYLYVDLIFAFGHNSFEKVTEDFGDNLNPVGSNELRSAELFAKAVGSELNSLLREEFYALGSKL